MGPDTVQEAKQPISMQFYILFDPKDGSKQYQ
jgi:hypothetical protein